MTFHIDARTQSSFEQSPPSQASSTTSQLYLVFQGGGIAALVYAGAIEALAKRGLLTNLGGVAGTSAGAITAALLATGHTPEQIKALLKTNFSKLTQDTKGGGLWESISDGFRLVRHYGLNGSNGLLVFLRESLGDVTFQDLTIPLEVFAVQWDRLPWRLTCFSKTTTPNVSVAEACCASARIPVFYTPFEVGGVAYIDGGVVANYPARATSFPQDAILGFRLHETTGGDRHRQGGLRGFLGTIVSGLVEAAQIGPAGREVWIDRLGVRATDFNISEEKQEALVAEGFRAVEGFFGSGV